MYEAQYNMGISYVNELVANKDKFTTNTKDPNYKKDLEAAKEYYRKALPYLEKTRELAPDQPKVWGLALKNVYYNLEMKDKEKEIDGVLASAGIVEPSKHVLMSILIGGRNVKMLQKNELKKTLFSAKR